MRSNSTYLTLALDVRKLTDSLISLVEGRGESDQLYAPLREVLASLESTGQKTSVKSLKERGAFGRHENVVTINRVLRGEDRSNFIKTLRAVISPTSPEQKRQGALEAIPFFDALERRALYYYGHPKPFKRVASSK
jgi:hypothetical protein